MSLRFLVIEDDEDDYLLLVRELQRGGLKAEYHRIADRSELLQALTEDWDLILCDYSLPGFGGLDALDLVRQADAHLPFIVVSGAITEDMAVSAMRRGAHDYVMKGNLARLVPAVQREIEEAALRREKAQLEEEAELQRRVFSLLQDSLLPKETVIPGLSYHYVYRSATDTAKIGGDFLDVFSLCPDSAWVNVGDVAGKGIAAAGQAVAIRSYLRAFSGLSCHPAEVVMSTNRLVSTETAGASFITLFSSCVDLSEDRLTYCSAGHPPALVKRGESGEIVALAACSPAVGPFRDPDFGQKTIDFAAGDLLLLYTDGLTEARRGEDFFEVERIVETLTRCDAVPQVTVMEVLQEVIDYTSGRLSDDLLLLAVTRTG